MRRECWERFPRHWPQRKPLVCDPVMHHGTCVTHVSWCIPGACTTRNVRYLVRDTCTKRHDILIGMRCRSKSKTPDSKVHVANMGPTWVLSAPVGPHVGPMNLAITDTRVICSYIDICDIFSLIIPMLKMILPRKDRIAHMKLWNCLYWTVAMISCRQFGLLTLLLVIYHLCNLGEQTDSPTFSYWWYHMKQTIWYKLRWRLFLIIGEIS